MLDFASVSTAMKSFNRVYFCYPVQAGLLNATSIFADVAREAGVDVLVNLSQGSANENALSPTSREHWLAERIFDWSGVPVIHLRAAVFFENLLRQTEAKVRANGVMSLAFGEGDTIIPLIAGEDVAHAGAALLSEPHRYIGQTINVTGPQTLSAIDCAETYSDVLGKPVTYVGITDEQQRADLEGMLGTHNPVQIEHLTKLWTLLRGAAIRPFSRMGMVSPALEKFTGSAGTTWAQFLHNKLKT